MLIFTPRWGPFGMEVNYLCVHLIMFPLSLFVAEMATTMFDEPAVKLARWLFEADFESSVREERQKKWAP